MSRYQVYPIARNLIATDGGYIMGRFSNWAGSLFRRAVEKVEEDKFTSIRVKEILSNYSDAFSAKEQSLVSQLGKSQLTDKNLERFRRDRRKKLLELDSLRKQVKGQETGRLLGQAESLALSKRDKELTDAETLEVTKLESDLAQQFNVLKKFTESLDELISIENKELLVDIHRPIRAYNEYVQKLKSALRNFGVPLNTENEIKGVLDQISAGCLELTNKFEQAMQKEFSENPMQPMDLTKVLADRVALRKQLNGQVNGVMNSIRSLESKFLSLSESRVWTTWLTPTDTQKVVDNVMKFRNNFISLSNYVDKRIVLSNHIVVSALALKKEKLEELKKISEELKSNPSFSKQFEAFTKEMAQSVNVLENKEVRAAQLEHQEAEALAKDVSAEVVSVNREMEKSKQELTVINANNLGAIQKLGLFFRRTVVATLLLVQGVQITAPLIAEGAPKDADNKNIVVVTTDDDDYNSYSKDANLTGSLNTGFVKANIPDFIIPPDSAKKDLKDNIKVSKEEKIVDEKVERRFEVTVDDFDIFSPQFSGEEGPVDSSALAINFHSAFDRNMIPAQQEVKDSVFKILIKEGMLESDAKRYVDTLHADVQIISMEAEGFTDAATGGYIKAQKTGKGNFELAELRRDSALSRLKDILAPTMNISLDSLNKIYSNRSVLKKLPGRVVVDDKENISQGRANTVKNVIEMTNDFVKSLPDQQKQRLVSYINQYFKLYGKRFYDKSYAIPDSASGDELSEQLRVVYEQYSNRGGNLHRREVGKLDAILKFIRFGLSDQYSQSFYKDVKESLSHLRKAKVKMVFNIKVNVKHKKIFFIPFDAILPPPQVFDRVATNNFYNSQNRLLKANNKTIIINQGHEMTGRVHNTGKKHTDRYSGVSYSK